MPSFRFLRTCAPALASLALCSLDAWAQFTPNDPYFLPDVSGNVTAAGYYGQWHLRNLMPITSTNAGLDANLWGAWQRGLTGNGVIISIIDDGTQGNHPEFVSKFQNHFSWDYSLSVAANNAMSYRGSPVLANDNHGTAVAGVAAAAGGNGLGGTGAAPLAGVAVQRFLVSSYSGNVSQNQAEVWAIGFQGQTNGGGDFDPSVTFNGTVGNVRVMNHSYGPNVGYGFGPDWELVHPALAASAQKKVIHVYSAGNQRGEWTTQDSNTILTNTSPDAIVVAALGSNGQYSDYSSYGANVMVTAPSSSRVPTGQFRISTTDRTGAEGYNDTEDGPDAFFTPITSGDLGNYTSAFGGTSSAAPLVSGIMALGVEANSDMDLRMARHLLAQTSVKVDPGNSAWITNAAGYNFNRNYGFGLIDADAFTKAATEVVGMSSLVVHTEAEVPLTGQVFGAGNLTLSQTYTVNHLDPMPIEYVQVRLALTGLQGNLTAYQDGIGAILGDISGILTAPSGTTYELFSNDRNLLDTPYSANRAVDDEVEWTFLSYAYFGEGINGNWTLTLTNNSTNTDYANFGEWVGYQLVFGTGTITMIPEPSTLAFVLLTGALWAARRRRVRSFQT